MVSAALAFNDDLLQQGCSNAHERGAAHNAALASLHKKATVHMHPSLHAGELDIIDCQMLHTESTACSFKKQGCQSSDAAQ